MRILVKDIKNNMIIDEDIYSDEGALIISKGLSVSDNRNLKDILYKNNIKKIKVLLLSDVGGADIDLEPIDIGELEKLDYESSQKKEIENFVNEFNSIVNDFEHEIISTMSGNGDRQKLEKLLQDAIDSNINKNTNIFQLLQKLKDTDDLTFTHCNSVSLTSYTIGKWLKLPQEAIKEISLAALLFDVGKYNIPSEILTKQDKLSFNDYELVKTHVDQSLEILKSYDLSENIMNAVKFHHERCDGSGYPYGLKGEQIPTMAKIIALADVFVALTSKRPYREKYTPFEAIKILETEYMQKLDIVILSEFIKRIASNYIGSSVILSNNQVGEVLFINATSPLRPIIKIKDTGDLLDLSAKANANIEILEFL